MAHPDPEPEPTAATEAAVAAEAAQDNGDDGAAGAAVESEDAAEPTPDPEKAERTIERLMWSSAWLTVLVGVFLVVGIARSDSDYSAFAWLGAVVAFLGLLVPTDNTPALAVLLPWAVTYWLYGLEKTEAPTP